MEEGSVMRCRTWIVLLATLVVATLAFAGSAAAYTTSYAQSDPNINVCVIDGTPQNEAACDKQNQAPEGATNPTLDDLLNEFLGLL
jgi:hypothetical protein